MGGFNKLAEKFAEEYGKHAAIPASQVVEADRIPTGIFPLDLATGGGIPRGRVTELFGAEGTCKSNVLYKTIASNQKLHPEEANALIDIENTFTPAWGKRMGLDVENLLLCKPYFGEQAVDMMEALLNDPECGVVGLDSLAFMVSGKEIENPADKDNPGVQAQLSKKLTNKVVTTMRKVEEDNRTPAFIYINQIRSKVMVMGDPTTTPGGHSPKFACSLRIRFFGKDVIEKKWSTTHPARKEIRAVIIKHKVPIVAKECIFEMAMIPHAGLMPGDIEDWPTLWHYLTQQELVTKKGNEYIFRDEPHKTQKSIREYLRETPKIDHEVRQQIIQVELAKAYNEQHQGKKE